MHTLIFFIQMMLPPSFSAYIPMHRCLRAVRIRAFFSSLLLDGREVPMRDLSRSIVREDRSLVVF